LLPETLANSQFPACHARFLLATRRRTIHSGLPNIHPERRIGFKALCWDYNGAHGMALTSGTELGPYKIVSLLGAGGMGEVYRATDSKLGRDVALKVILQEFAQDAQLMARFQREAQVLASLNHTNIASIYDLGESGGVSALVMELVEGPTLAERIKEGAIPIEEALPIAKQIAEALEYAHEHGIIHRDLKPANIKLTHDGKVKVLDFGLAKPLPDDASAHNISNSPTLSMAATKAGIILGTAAYMSPEQARGKTLDKRTDIWAFGVMLYEMLTGQRPFCGETMTETLAAIIKEEPQWEAIPAKARLLLQRCLEKDPKRRLRDIGDAMPLLESAALPGLVAPPPARRQWLWPSIAAVLLAALALLSFAHFREAAPAAEPTRFSIPPPEEAAFVSGPPWGSPLAVSPDGRRIVFVAAGKDGKRRLWVRPLDSLADQPLVGTEGASAPFWSPESKWIAFFANGKIMRVAATGGEAQTLCQCQSGGGGGTWNQDNVILFSPAVAGASGLFRVPAAGGAPLAVTTLDSANGEIGHVWPVFLPDGQHFLYNINGGDRSGIYVGDLNSTKRLRLLPLDEISTLGYALPGYLLYVRGRVLFAQAFDAKRLSLADDPIRVLEGVENAGPGSAAFSVSSSGVLVYWGGAVPRSEQLTWVRRNGMRIATVGPPGAYFHFSLSPDERRVAVTRYEPGEGGLHTAIWLLDVLRGMSTKFTFEWGAGMPVWSPDASHIVFASSREGPPALYQRPTSGPVGQDEVLVKGGDNHPTDWSPDGRTIVYEVLDAKTRNDLWLLSLSGQRKSVPLIRSPFNETGGRISPDGRWMAYASDESGRDEMYVTNYPEPRGKWRVSPEGGTQAEWRRDGRELFYRAPDRKVMAVPIKSGANFDAGTPQALFEIPPDVGPWLQGGVDQREYAVSSDGQRFLIGVKVGEESSAPLTVVVNWTAGLRRD
jgi:serine/threonine protein kinase/Tol biopolymer transport system component